MEGHAKKCVERYCELANRTTQQLYKVSTPCIDDHHFREEELKSVGELSNVCSRNVLKCLYLARIGRPDILFSVLCKYMRVMLRRRAKMVENGRVRQWPNQRLHEHLRIPPVSVEVAVRRFGWLQAMLRDETNHAQPLAAIVGRFLGKDVLEGNGGLCEGANPFAVALHRDVFLFEGVTGTELFEALRKNGFHSLFVIQSDAREAFLRFHTSLLRSACWTMASGMRLELHVKSQWRRNTKVRLVL